MPISKFANEITAQSLDPHGFTIDRTYAGNKRKKKKKKLKSNYPASHARADIANKIAKSENDLPYESLEELRQAYPNLKKLYKSSKYNLYLDGNNKFWILKRKKVLWRSSDLLIDDTRNKWYKLTKEMLPKTELIKKIKGEKNMAEDKKSNKKEQSSKQGGISKMSEEMKTRMNEMVEALKSKIDIIETPDGVVELNLKQAKALYEDLYHVLTEYNKEEATKTLEKTKTENIKKDKEEEPKKEPEEEEKVVKEDTDKEDDDDEDDEDDDDEEDEKDTDTSKHEDLKKELKVTIENMNKFENMSKESISKLGELNVMLKAEKEKNKTIMDELVSLRNNISKFEKKEYENILDDTVNKISKFCNYSKSQIMAKKTSLKEASLSKSALVALGSQFDEALTSKFDKEPVVDTIPSDLMGESESKIAKFEDLSSDDKLEYLANENAKEKGYGLKQE